MALRAHFNTGYPPSNGTKIKETWFAFLVEVKYGHRNSFAISADALIVNAFFSDKIKQTPIFDSVLWISIIKSVFVESPLGPYI
jgi:hypothetical protein